MVSRHSRLPSSHLAAHREGETASRSPNDPDRRLQADERWRKNGKKLSRATVDYMHAIQRKASNDAVRLEQLLTINPAEEAKPRSNGDTIPCIMTSKRMVS
jgi:hypothetical protein